MYYFASKFLDSQQYSYKANINNWVDAHVGTQEWENVRATVS